ncbi:hypothetical protein BJY01DRAFT_167225 [Aspergillus pseudoustus]|uniref:Uncharacterized protein n=1 Tax=Aspergillus pseudoustus TaxID=1810923 RepID=A0ABR4IA94_9EURO
MGDWGGRESAKEAKRQKRSNTSDYISISGRVFRGLANAGVKKKEEKGGKERKKEKETRRAKESASIVWIPGSTIIIAIVLSLFILYRTCYRVRLVRLSSLQIANDDQLGNVVDREAQVPPFSVEAGG